MKGAKILDNQAHYHLGSKFQSIFQTTGNNLFNKYDSDKALMEEEKPNIYEERPQEEYQTVWVNYKGDQLGWLAHFYQSAGQKGQQALKKAQLAFDQLYKKLSQSHYNTNNRYFITFAELQGKKYYRMNPFLPTRYLSKKYQQSSQQLDLQISLEQGAHFKDSDKKAYRYMLFYNYKSVLQVLTLERYKFSNVAKHILRNKKGSSLSEIANEGIIFDVERGKKVDWKTTCGGLLFVFIRSIRKGLAELQSKLILHCDIKDSNILLYNCQNLSDLSDPAKLAAIIDKIQFKIIDFDHALLLGQQHLSKTKDLLKLKDKIRQKQHINLHYDLTMPEISEDINIMIKTKHSNSFVSCIENIAKLVKDETQQVGDWIKMAQNHDDSLISKMEEKIQAFKNKYK